MHNYKRAYNGRKLTPYFMPHIAIAGGGIAGLATAIHLTRLGESVSVYEQVLDPTPVGAGLLLQPSGQAMLEELNLLDKVKAKAARVDSLEGYSGGWKSLDLHYKRIHAEWHGLGIHRASLHQILWQCAIELGVPIHLGQGITTFEQDEQGVFFRVSDAGGVKPGDRHDDLGDQGGHTDRADALIIANGTRSQLRAQLPIPQVHKPYPWGAFWTVLDKDDWPFPHILMQRYRSARVMLGVLPTGINPLTGQQCYSLFWSLPKTAFGEYQMQGMQGLIQRIAPIWPEVAQWLSMAPKTPIAIAEYADVRLRQYHHQRVLVMGDAAHAMSPQLGQGANMALIDASILAKSWSAHKEHKSNRMNVADVTDTFAQFSQRRRKQIAYYQMASKLMTPLYQSNYPIGWLRDIGTSIGHRIPAVYRQYLLTLCGAKQGILDFGARIEDL